MKARRAWFLVWSTLAFLALTACGSPVGPDAVEFDSVTVNHSGVVEFHVSGPARRASDFMAVDTSAVLSL